MQFAMLTSVQPLPGFAGWWYYDSTQTTMTIYGNGTAQPVQGNAHGSTWHNLVDAKS